ncbi:IS1182 family transposase [Gelria sp. Kuro-4]|uniref:IS1182 family transposase n=1 Tax=Gelria sp. Kuro-4 TaxID=2796927 RepID=UPI001BF04B73|nr:IS1182 family transposase [Gelria sp. Kuro-4]BCV24993.1 transposase [Gelria sp. Kuro-4]BCV25937.1 transposase [Gelria sp. Kuro-4]
MLKSKDGQQDFFDLHIFSRMIPEDHPLVQIKKNVDFSFVTGVVADLYDPVNGRPSYPPESLFRVLFLEVWAGLSDVQVCRELKYNVLYRWFCDFGWDDIVPDDTTLVVFRKRLGEEKFRELFERVVEEAKAKKCLRGHWTIIDGTKVIAHVAVKNTLSLVREGRKRVLRNLARVDAAKAEELQNLAAPLPDADYSSHTELLAAEIEQGKKFLAAVGDCTTDESVGRECALYAAVLNGEGVASFSDPEARWGFKKKDEPFLGYKVHAACDETGIVTAVEVTPGNEAELEPAKEMIAALEERELKASRLAADKGYDDSTFRTELVESNIKPYIPNRTKKDRLEEQGFKYNPKSKVLRCKAGKKAIGSTPHKNGGLTYYFSEKDCAACPYRNSCLSKTETRKRAYVKPEVLANRPRGIKIAMRIRRTIERIFGEAKTWHGMARARYRGRFRVAIQVFLTFICLNVKKMAQRIAAQLATA